MLLYPLQDMVFINKGKANKGRNPPFCFFPFIAFINQEATGCISGEARRRSRGTGLFLP